MLSLRWSDVLWNEGSSGNGSHMEIQSFSWWKANRIFSYSEFPHSLPRPLMKHSTDWPQVPGKRVIGKVDFQVTGNPTNQKLNR
jgi:hypothetical protein